MSLLTKLKSIMFETNDDIKNKNIKIQTAIDEDSLSEIEIEVESSRIEEPFETEEILDTNRCMEQEAPNEQFEMQSINNYMENGDIEAGKELGQQNNESQTIAENIETPEIKKYIPKDSIKVYGSEIFLNLRTKLYDGTIENEDLEILKEQEEIIDKKQYYLILTALYERLGQKKNALTTIKKIEEENIEVKGLGYIKDYLKSKKTHLFDLNKWDNIIGWDLSPLEESNNDSVDYTNNISDIEEMKSTEEHQDEVIYKTNSKKREKVYITSSIITNKSTVPKQKTKTNARKKEKDKSKKNKEKTTIYETIGFSTKEAVEEISRKYYMEMQPKKTITLFPERYYDLLNNITETNSKDKKKRMEEMKDILKNMYDEGTKQQKYIKKYDKLQTILESSKDNQRAKMQLILVLINEGYKEVAQLEFPQDYLFVSGLIQDYQSRKITADQVKSSIDEYCL